MPQLDGDPAEQVLLDCEEASGERPVSCPWSAFRDPYVIAVLDAYPRRNSLPESTPDAIEAGVWIYDRALNRVQVRDYREDAAKRAAEQKQRENERTLTR